jgi:hypothetical protein
MAAWWAGIDPTRAINLHGSRSATEHRGGADLMGGGPENWIRFKVRQGLFGAQPPGEAWYFTLWLPGDQTGGPDDKQITVFESGVARPGWTERAENTTVFDASTTLSTGVPCANLATPDGFTVMDFSNILHGPDVDLDTSDVTFLVNRRFLEELPPFSEGLLLTVCAETNEPNEQTVWFGGGRVEWIWFEVRRSFQAWFFQVWVHGDQRSIFQGGQRLTVYESGVARPGFVDRQIDDASNVFDPSTTLTKAGSCVDTATPDGWTKLLFTSVGFGDDTDLDTTLVTFEVDVGLPDSDLITGAALTLCDELVQANHHRTRWDPA